MAPGAIVPVFQPIVRIQDRHIIGYEALARFPRASAHSSTEPTSTCIARSGRVAAAWTQPDVSIRVTQL